MQMARHGVVVEIVVYTSRGASHNGDPAFQDSVPATCTDIGGGGRPRVLRSRHFACGCGIVLFCTDVARKRNLTLGVVFEQGRQSQSGCFFLPDACHSK